MTRFVAFASTLAVCGALSVAATSAPAAAATCPEPNFLCEKIENFEVFGTLHDKKLNQDVQLKEGAFNGIVAITGISPITGVIQGVTTAKPFEAPIKLFGLTAKVGLTFEEVGEANGVLDQIEPAGNCLAAPSELCVHESIPTQANLGFTSITLFGLKIPLHCKTSKTVSLPLEEDLMLFAELLNPKVGSHFTGETTFPSISCNFFEEPLTAVFNSVLLTSLFSGPGNTYSLFVKHP
jgi:hypothetical protein